MPDFAAAVKWDLLPFCYGEGLDLGCGDARPHDFFVGIDIKAGTTPKGPNLIGDARDLKRFADASQDYIFSSYLLNELEDWQAVLRGWWRILKPEGYLIIFLPLEPGKCEPTKVVDAMAPLKPWQFVEARVNGEQFFQVYRKSEKPHTLEKPDPDKTVAVVKLGAHGDALWASSIFPGLKAQGFHTILYTQDTGESVLRHDPHIDQIIRFESRVPMGELGELFRWIEMRYRHSRILVEVVEGTLLPSPQKIQYHFPKDARDIIMGHNYVEMHHRVAKVPIGPRVKFYPSDSEKEWANKVRLDLRQFVVALVPNGSSCTKHWPYAADLVNRLVERPDVTVVLLGDQRGVSVEDHPQVLKIGESWNIRQAMTFCQLANVVVGQETGLLNCVSHEPDVRKVVLLTHSTHQNLTRDWPNTAAIVGESQCTSCHQLHYDWSNCKQNPVTRAAECQTGISVASVLYQIEPAIRGLLAA